MYQRTRSNGTAMILLMLVLVVTVSCSLFSGGTGIFAQATETPTETHTPLPSPTETITPTPTETPLPSLTPTPSFDWCKGMNTRLAKEEDINVGPVTGDQAFASFACLVEVVGTVRDFPEPAIVVKLGFNDKSGGLHIYNAVIGGLIGKAEAPTGFSYPTCYKNQDPPMLSLEEYVEKLRTYTQAGAKEFPVLVLTQLGYKRHWPPEASQVNRYSDQNAALKTAVETGEGFPEVPERFRLFTLPGLEACP